MCVAAQHKERSPRSEWAGCQQRGEGHDSAASVSYAVELQLI